MSDTTRDLVPPSLTALMAGRPADESVRDAVDGDTWLRRLPGVLDELLAEQDLAVDGRPRHGQCAVVIPVLRRGAPAALKVSWPHAEAAHEHLALRAWDGSGAVRLLAADPARWALLLERLDPERDLGCEPVLDACETVGRLHALLDRPAIARLGTASAWCGRIRERLTTSPPPVPPRVVDQGLHLATELAADPGVDARLVHGDLHDANVLRVPDPGAARAGTVDGWLAIDPKPVAGELALTVAPLLWNRWDEAARAHNLRNHLRFRVDYACDAAGIDPARARAWTILRELDNAWWAAREPGGHDRITQAVAIIKAMRD